MHQAVKNIINIRKQLGFSQEYIADKLGINRSTYARFEGSPAKIDLNLIERIAKEIFDMEVTEVIDYHKILEAKTSPITTLNTAEESKVRYKTGTFTLIDLLNTKNELIKVLYKTLTDKDEIIRFLKNK